MINWNARFNASSSHTDDDIQTIMLQGVLIDSTVNANGWQIEESDLADIARQSVGAQLRLDHSGDVRRVKGQILEAELDQPHSEDHGPHDPANENVHVHFKAEMVTNDPDLIIPITRGYVNRVSIGADAKSVFCSNCGKPTRPIKRCGCKAHEILKDIIVREYSIVTTPAYESAVFTPFAAAVDKFLEGDSISEETIDIDATKAPISVTSETTNINYFNGATAEPVVPTITSTTDFVAEVVEASETVEAPEVVEASKVEVTASEVEEVEEEVANLDRGEDPKDAPKNVVVNVNKDEIKDPGIMKKAKEELKMTDETPVEANSTDMRIDALTASIESLVATLTAVKAEVDEDEEKVEAEMEPKEEVKADDGYPLKDHSVDVGSPIIKKDAPSPVVSPGPVDGTVSKELPQKTPSMGVSAGLVMPEVAGTDLDTKSINEIFAFVAKRSGW